LAAVSSGNLNQANENCGWASKFEVFSAASIDEVVSSLVAFVRDSTPEEIRAWKGSVPGLQKECIKSLEKDPDRVNYGAILEYRMPDGPHRVDAVLLVSGSVLVLEFKGDGNWQPSYLEQAADYARRLYWWHAKCGESGIRVHTMLVAYGQEGVEQQGEFYTLTNLSNLANVIERFDRSTEGAPISVADFIAPGVCQPSMSLVQAARSFFAKNELPTIKRIDEVTSGAVLRITDLIHETAHHGGRRLILLSGVPGAGKTFVGLKIAHAEFLDDLIEIADDGSKSTVPAVFLSGNGPLVDVLQYELRKSGADGRVFVRGVKDFVKRHSKRGAKPPPHHVLIFDEAQRAWDAERVQSRHADQTKSEPAAFLEFAERVPGWCVILGLIGDGQQIHGGEEGGVKLWVDAIDDSEGDWGVAASDVMAAQLGDLGLSCSGYPELHLAKSVRFNFAAGLSSWVSGLVDGELASAELREVAEALRKDGYQLRITRSIENAKDFLWKKYHAYPQARFGMLKSSRDKSLKELGIHEAGGRFFRAGPWYADPEESPNSCRRLLDAATEFGSQGLELDHCLVVWGTDFIRSGDSWSIELSKKYTKRSGVKDAANLRRNAYRVLLTRGREGCLVCLPECLQELDETYEFLMQSGCEVLA
jgi:hypothetical protein